MKRLLIALVLCVALVGVVAADTAIFYTTNSTDGYVFRNSANSTFSSIVTSAGTGSYDTTAYCRAWVVTDTFTDRYKTNSRCVNWFDTSSLPDDAIITSAVVQERVYTVATDFAASTTNVTMVNFAVDGGLSSDDYDNFGNTVLSNEFKVNSIATGNLLNFTMNAYGLSNISKTGNTGIMFLTNHDQKQTAPTWAAGGDLYAGAAFNSADSVTFKPFITLAYTSAPPSLTGLTNTSPSCNSLQFNYTVPSGVGEILVYRNNTQLTNLTNSSTGVLWEGLPEDTDVTFSSRTCSIDGLACNATWVNMTTRTSTCAASASVPETDWPWCADQDIFFWNASSDISGYRCMTHMPEKAAQSTVTSPSFTSSAEVTLGTWATPPGSPGVSSIGPGLFRFRTYAYASSSSGITSLKFYVLNRSSSGTETNLFYGNAITEDINGGTVPTEYLLSYARRNYTTMFAGDRLVIRVNASTDSASPRTVTMDVGGNTNASMVSISYFLCRDTTSGTAIHSSGVVSHGMPTPVPVIVMAVVIVIFLAAIKRKE